ncbi:BTE_collapsed_G0004170.mRNA.1.CDS.1 [Saccharomyces cerevisiae]|nr:BTE_collapsed_G0004170.mRNA.1.CDS.1 [Saccharomyces cerevisiae]
MFHKSSVTGFPIMNPMFIEHPEFAELYLHHRLLVKPVTEPGQSETAMSCVPSEAVYSVNSCLFTLFSESAMVLPHLLECSTFVIFLHYFRGFNRAPLFIAGGHHIFSVPH